jgi:hypothetical protein
MSLTAWASFDEPGVVVVENAYGEVARLSADEASDLADSLESAARIASAAGGEG